MFDMRGAVLSVVSLLLACGCSSIGLRVDGGPTTDRLGNVGAEARAGLVITVPLDKAQEHGLALRDMAGLGVPPVKDLSRVTTVMIGVDYVRPPARQWDLGYAFGVAGAGLFGRQDHQTLALGLEGALVTRALSNVNRTTSKLGEGPSSGLELDVGAEVRAMWVSNDVFARDLLLSAGPLAELRYRLF
jgi:hypothetical protein